MSLDPWISWLRRSLGRWFPRPRRPLFDSLRIALLLGALGLIVLTPASSAPPAFVKLIGTATSTATGTTISVSVPVGGVAAGNSIILSFATKGTAGTVSATDSAGNSYSVDADVTNATANSSRLVILSARSVSALSSGQTITVTGPSTAVRVLSAVEFSGIAIADRSSTATGSSTTPSSGTTATTSTNSQLVFGASAFGYTVQETYTPGTGYALVGRAGVQNNSPNDMTVNPQYKVISSPGAQTSNGTNSSTHPWAAAVVTYYGGRSILGNVFEDVNYGGGAGRSKSASGGVGLAGATVELYNSGGTYVTSTSTAADGSYGFSGLAAGTYHVRVVSNTVDSQRSGSTAALVGVLTYRTDASSGTPVAVVNQVGGTNPSLVDPGTAGIGTTFNTSTYVYSIGLFGTAHAVTPVVVGGSDVVGVDFGFNFDTVVNTNDSGQGSLRQAITNANTLAGDSSLAQAGRTAGIENLIFMLPNGSTANGDASTGGKLALSGGLRSSFNAFSGGVATLTLSSALPTISAPLVIDAQTQPGWTTTPVVMLEGNFVLGDGISIAAGADASSFSGLIVRRFLGRGIYVASGASGVTITGNYIGRLNAAGTDAGILTRNTGDGIYNQGTGTVIGGNTAPQRNVIAGNGGIGVTLGGTGAIVRGNYIGVDATGATALGNSSYGVDVLCCGASATIGGAGSGEGNVISGNLNAGVLFEVSSTGSLKGNRIGTDATGTSTISGNGAAVWIAANGITVGGPEAGAGNTVSGANTAGIVVAGATTGVSILGNGIFGNSGLGIDLGLDGITTNDGLKFAGLPNLRMDYPVFTSATLAGTRLVVAGYVGSAAGQSTFANARVEVFISDSAQTNGSGKTYLGFLTTDASGNFSGSFTGVSGITPGTTKITGTATDGSGNTSEFGVNASVGYGISGTVFEDLNYGGGPGRDFATSGGAGISGATVELLNTTGTLRASTTTASDGSYVFASVPAGHYLVRVVQSTVRSTRSGSSASVVGVQTYRYESAFGAQGAVGNEVGGQDPTVADGAAGVASYSWTSCAAENATCSFTGTRVVRYGAGTTWTTQVLTGGTPCTNAVFGDPLVGTVKSCAVLAVPLHSVSSVWTSGSGTGGIDFGFSFDTVTNTNDSGQGSLRQAITNANTLGGDASLAQQYRSAGVENLVFMLSNGGAGGGGSLNLPAGGLRSALNLFTTSAGSRTVATITALSRYSITSGLVLDAQTQPGWTLEPRLEIRGDTAGAIDGLVNLSGGSVTVRGLVLNRYGGEGIKAMDGSSGHVIQGCWIGVTAAGNASAAIGLSAIWMAFSGNNHVIGGTTAATGNVLSGTTGFEGLAILGGSGHLIQGNYIGTDSTGSSAIALASWGIKLYGGVTATTIGGTAPGAANVISGSLKQGIYLLGSGITVQGNRIGTNAAGNAAIPNALGGILIDGSGNTIGGSSAAAGNVISGNSGAGIAVSSTGTGTIIRANLIGLNAAGTTALANSGDGISITSATGAVIGGATTGMGNAIGGNGGNAITLTSSSGHSILGNTIGTNATGTGMLATPGNGIVLSSTATTTIGGIAAGSGNTIRLSTAKAITITGATSTGNAIRGNAIYGSTALGIDLVNDGITANDGAKTLSQPNLLMDAPVFTSLSLTGTNLSVAGYVGSAAGQTTFASATVDVYVSDNANANGSGQTYLGTLTADASGNFSGTLSGVSGITRGSTRITGIATDGAGNSSEFGPNLVVGVNLSGTVFEDLNYGGGAGRDLSSSGGTGLSGATVELYTGAGTLAASTTTAANGSYSFTSLTPGHYVVRVVTSTLRSSRSGSIAGLWPVQTWRYEASWQTPSAVTGEVGGQQPDAADSGAAPTLTWTQCATENGGSSNPCNFSGTRLVRFGTGSTWTTRIATGGITCSTAVFGDPTPGLPKTCATLNQHLHSASSVYAGAGDVGGLDFGYSFDTVVNVNDSGQGSLRQAITNANTLGGDASLAQQFRSAGIEHIVFMIPNGTTGSGGSLSLSGGLRSGLNLFGSGIAPIAPTSALPTISTTMVLDARTQPGWSSAPIVELNGTAAGTGSKGLNLTASNATLAGFVINRFNGAGIAVASGTGNTVSGHYIGTTSAGTAASANAGGGITVASTGNTVGGTTAAARNVVSGNTGYGISISATGNTVLGNYIGTSAAGSAAVPNLHGVLCTAACTVGGTAVGAGNVVSGNSGRGVEVQASGVVIQGNILGLDATGTAKLGNGWEAVVIWGASTTVGGTASGARNIISGNGFSGLYVFGAGASGTQILGNYIGTDITGAVALGNSLQGVRLLSGATGVVIGGTATGAGNRIMGNGQAGVGLDSGTGTGNPIRGNSIWGNTGVGIDLLNDGATAAASTTTSGQANLLMSRPTLTRAVLGTNTLAVVGYVGDQALRSAFGGALVDLYVSDASSSYGSGRTWVGTVTANADGEFAGVVSTSGISGLVAGTTKITATATDASGNTSEFGNNLTTVALAALANGGFETGVSPGAWMTLSTGDTTNLGSWVVTGNSIEVVGTGWTAAEGSRSLDLSGNTRGGVAQVVSTVAGQSYTVAFSLAGNAAGGVVRNLRVTAGSTSGTFTFDTTGTTPTNMGWVDRSVTFTATSEATVLWFESLDAALGGPVLDNVRLVSGTVGSIGGTVFEDVNYGGGAGRPRAGAAGSSVRSGATVELYSAAGALLATTTTDAGGAYLFSNLAYASYTVRVAGRTVSSSRSGWVSGLVPVVTYRVNASGGIPTADTAFVGGANPLLDEAAANTGSQTLAALTSASATPQAISTVALATSVSGIDFGFNFSTVTNTNDSGAGSLRQFLVNANAFTDQASLAQSGLRSAVGGGTESLPAGVETSIFMIPSGSAVPGLRAALPSGLTGGVAILAPATQLPTITRGSVSVDGTTQTVNVGNTNPVTLGTGGTVGTQNVALATIPGPEVQINGVSTINRGLDITGANVQVRGLSVWGFGAGGDNSRGSVFWSNTGNATLDLCAVGSTATSATDPRTGGVNQYGNAVYLIGVNGATVRRNFIGYAFRGLIVHAGSGTQTVTGNELAGPTGWTVLEIWASSGVTATGNLIRNQGSAGAGLAVSIGGGASNTTLQNNTVRDSAGAGITVASSSTASGASLSNNIVTGNGAAGAVLLAGASGIQLSQNSIYGNAGIGIDLSSSATTADGISANDGAKTAGTGNLKMDFPVFTNASLSGSTLTVSGYVGSAAGQSTFAGARVEVFASDASQTNGSGQTYLGFLTADASGNFAGTITGVTGVTNGSTRITGTATDGSGNTSEFGPNLTPGFAISGTVFEDLNYGGGAGRSRSAASGAPVAGARVELFDASGSFVSATTTASDGSYGFSTLADNTTYHVRVVSGSVLSTRSGAASSLVGVLTFRTSTSAGTVSAVTDNIGGTNPGVADAGNAGTGTRFSTSTYVFSAGLSGTAHAVAPVGLMTANVTGVDFGFNFDTVTNVNDSGQGSLRQAITNANTLGGDSGLAVASRTAGVEHLVFMIPNGSAAAGLRSAYNAFSGGVATISPSSALPTVAATLVLDAQTQPGWTSTPVVELNGSGAAGTVHGVVLNAANAVLRGFAVNRFNGDGIRSLGGTGVVIQGNHVGTHPSGTSIRANTSSGIYVSAGTVLIGGTGAGTGNLVSGNGSNGIYVGGGTVTVQGNTIGLNLAGTAALANGWDGVGLVGGSGHVVGGSTSAARNVIAGNLGSGVFVNVAATVQGNYIGTNGAGNAAIGNTRHGIYVSASGATVGGTAAGAGNLIAASGMPGIELAPTASGSVVQGNIVGMNATRTAALGNAKGMVIQCTTGCAVGGSTAGAGNTVSGNLDRGIIVISPSAGNALLGNEVWGNTGIGIDLADDGATANDGAVTAGQANLLMDAPVFSSATYAGGTLTVSGYVGSAAGQSTFGGSRVEVFISDGSNPSGQGKTYLGFVTADASGNFSGTIPVASGITPGTTAITGTATGTGGNTSEFGANKVVGWAIAGTVFEDLNYGGGAGRSLSASSGAPVAGARVELFDASGNFVSATTTASDGSYSFSGLAGSATFHVRVVSGSVLSTRSGATSSLLGVLTYRTSTSAGSVSAVSDNVGGTNPGVADVGSASSGTRFNTSTYVFSAGLSGTAHAVAPVGLASANVSGVDFGFNFDTVVNTRDSGQGSLRQVITNANALGGDASLAVAGRTAGLEHVVFMMPNGSNAAGLRSAFNVFSAGVASIAPTSALPGVSASLVLDAQTQPGWTANPIIELNGSGAGATAGLQLTAGTSILRGFIINRFGAGGLALTGGSGHVVQGHWIGLNSTGTAASANTGSAVTVSGGSNHVIGGTTAAGRNVLSGNTLYGVDLAAGGGHVVQGNSIGLNAAGTAGIPNGSLGVYVRAGVTSATVGGATAGAGNLVSGSDYALWLGGGPTVVQGNWIGLAADGVTSLPHNGIFVASSGHLIGGTTALARNVIASSTNRGIWLDTSGNTVQGNYVGTDVSGTIAVPNVTGIYVKGAGNVVGGTAAGAGNLVSGNTGDGILLNALGDGSVVQGNVVGLNAAGTARLPNGTGITVSCSTGCTIGGTASGAGNVVSGNSGNGIAISGSGIVVQGNVIGLNAAGTAKLFNGANGISIVSGTGIQIGGSSAAARNVISGNALRGVLALVSNAAASGFKVQGNVIGLGSNGSTLLGNGTEGIYILGSSDNTIGGTGAGEGNVIAGNGARGVLLQTSPTLRNRIQRNSIWGNTGLGIDLDAIGVMANDGLTSATLPNAGMDFPVLTSARARGNQLTVSGYVGLPPGTALFSGATVEVFASDNTGSNGQGRTWLGSFTVQADGTFSGTATMPVPVLAVGTVLTATATDTSGNTSEFGPNFASLVVDLVVNDKGDAVDANPGDGLCATAGGVCTLRAALQEFNALPAQAGGTPALAFALPGCSTAGQAACSIQPGSVLPTVARPLTIDGQSQPGWTQNPLITLDGSSAGAVSGLTLNAAGAGVRGLIVQRYASGYGVLLSSGASGATVQGNWLGIDASGAAAGNLVGLGINASAVTVGGLTAASRNIVSGNATLGAELQSGAVSALVIGNWFGLGSDGNSARGNGTQGLRSVPGASVQIGGTVSGQANRFGGNGSDGVALDATGGSGGTLQGNVFGLGIDGSTAVPNGRNGIWLIGGSWVIGGSGSNEANTIRGNGSNGVLVNHGASARISANAISGNTLLGIDLGHTGASTSGTGNGITANDGLTNASQADNGIDMPVLNGVGVSPGGTALTVSGFVGTGTGQAAFAGARIELFRSDGSGSGYGQGRLYLGSLTADASGRFYGTVAIAAGSLSVGDPVTATATDAANANTSEFSANWTSTTLAALAPAGFNAFDSDTVAGSLLGVLRSRVAGVATTVDVVALDSTGTGLHPGFTGSVTLNWLDARNDSGGFSGSCRSSWVPLGSAGSVSFSSSARASVSLVPPASGTRAMRLQIVYAGPTGTVTACSGDAFAALPAQIAWIGASDADSATAGTARALDNTSASGGVVHRAGRPFTVRAQALSATGAVMTGYDGTPQLAIAGCVLPAGCTAGALGGGQVAAVGGLYTHAAVSYAEVGAIALQLTDSDFAAVDAADTPVASRTLQSTTLAVGRFVPDGYTLAVSRTPVLGTANAACLDSGSGSTFFGQGFGWSTAPQITVTARNAAGAVTTLWGGSLMRIPAAGLVQTLSASGAGSTTLSGSFGAPTIQSLGAGLARLEASALDRFVLDAATPQTSRTPGWSYSASLQDASEAGVAGNPTLAASTGISGFGFNLGGVFHSGRLSLSAGFGDARSGVRALVQLQRWTDAGWVTMTEDRGCVTVTPQNLGVEEPSGVFATAGLCAAPMAASVTTRGGRAWIALPATPGGATGRLKLRLAGATAVGSSCTGASAATVTPLGLPWLLGGLDSAGPANLATWGSPSREPTLRREIW